MSAHHSLRSLIVAIVLTSTFAILPGCVTNPATGKRILATFDSATEIQMGIEAAPQLAAQFGGPVRDVALQDYVRQIGETLASKTEADFPDLPWEFTLLDSSMINAFALPGGKVFITRGLASRLTDEAQIAGVLGHEVAHVTAQHANQRMSQQSLLAGGLGIVTAVLVGADGSADSDMAAVVPALQIGGQLFTLKFGRGDELEADRLGMRYMSKSGWNPVGQREVMTVLAEASSGAGRPPEFLATHPYPETRIDEINKLLRERYANASGERYESRYRQRMLARLSNLPPASHTAANLTDEERATLARAFTIADCMGCTSCNEQDD